VLAGFGWAKPVPVNALNFRHPVRDMVWVAAAGPLSNFLAALAALVAVRLVVQTAPGGFVGEPLGQMLVLIYVFNLVLGVFNLIPLPPLDGGHFLPYLFPRAGSFIHQLEQAGPFLLLLLVFSGATDRVMRPIIDLVGGVLLGVVRLLM
jgi:Zn-dependent protease